MFGYLNYWSIIVQQCNNHVTKTGAPNTILYELYFAIYCHLFVSHMSNN